MPRMPARGWPRAGVITRDVLGVAALVLALLAGGCSAAQPPASPSAAPGSVAVVTTTTVFADLVRAVGGIHVSVTSLVPNGGDVHTYEPRPADLRVVAGARLLVMNGLGLDDWLLPTIANASATGTPLVKLAVDLPGVELLPGDAPDTENPHLWLDVRYAALYVDRIAQALAQVDPSHASLYQHQAAEYQTQLGDLDAYIRQAIGALPAANRRVVTYHDAFPYYARAYGLTVIGVAVEAPGQEPSAQYTAQLIEAIRDNDVKAIFSDNQFPTQLVDTLGDETGATVVADLYDGALSDSVTSYVAMMRWDTDHIAGALQ
jgi:ABC-type Zn uptake system ZnuABC Zn-binding protein ZnuA